jgi:GDP-mannose 6-dehydrogenase
VIERLLGKGYNLKVYDRNVNLASLVGANRDYIMNQIPHISKLMVGSIEEILDHADTIIIGNGDSEFSSIIERVKDNQVIVDFVRINTDVSQDDRYDGICW